ncbi:MAG: hypothetical protein ABJM90_20610 [Paracoccaceae bacterium]
MSGSTGRSAASRATGERQFRAVISESVLRVSRKLTLAAMQKNGKLGSLQTFAAFANIVWFNIHAEARSADKAAV